MLPPYPNPGGKDPIGSIHGSDSPKEIASLVTSVGRIQENKIPDLNILPISDFLTRLYWQNTTEAES
jgi:hypothetical protein